jgi:gliding motility-associated-like protein
LKKICFHIVLILLLASKTYGQTCFSLDKTTGCPGLTVTATDCSGAYKATYDFGDGSAKFVDGVTTHTYTTQGTYKVIQKVVTTSTCGCSYTSVEQIVTILPVRKPTFNLKFCLGGNVTLNITDDIDNQYVVNWGTGPTAVVNYNTPTNHTYTVDGTGKKITITPVHCGGIPVDTTIYPLDFFQTPDVTKVTVTNQHSSNGEIEFEFNAVKNQRYILQQSINNTTTYANIDTLTNLDGIQIIKIKNLNTQVNRYCYKLLSYDDCISPTLYPESKQICSIINTAVADPTNSEIDLSWSAHLAGNVFTYNIYRDDVKIASSGSTSYSDILVNCKVKYCYRIEVESNLTNIAGTNLQSVSDTQCVVALTSKIPPAVQNLNSTIQGNEISVSWNTPPGIVNKYTINRSANSNSTPFPFYQNYTGSIPFIDNNVNIPDNHYCFSVNYEDECGNTSLLSTSTTCPIVLSVSLDNNDNTINNLTWTPYSGNDASTITGYSIQVLDKNSNTLETITINSNSTLSYAHNTSGLNVQLVRYIVTPIKSTSTILTSNMVEIKYEGSIFLPNAFSPNGDGTNDVFSAKGKFIKSFKLTIFNRWGEVVYSDTDINSGWDGNYQNIPAPSSAYAYLVEAEDFWGKSFTKRGSVTLIK